MKALAAIPQQKNSLTLIDIAKPTIQDDEILVKTLMVGICGTDKEINEGRYGQAPKKSKHLIIGHEAFGVVERVGRKVSDFSKGDYVCPIVRRPGKCANCTIGKYDLCLDNNYCERGIKGLHGFASEYFKEKKDFLVTVHSACAQCGVLVEPLSIVEKGISQAYLMQQRMVWEPKRALVLGAGPIGMLAAFVLRSKGLDVFVADRSARNTIQASIVREIGGIHINVKKNPLCDLEKKAFDIVFEATGSEQAIAESFSLVGTNGVLILASLTNNDVKIPVALSKINQSFVLQNKITFGTVSARKEHFVQAAQDLAQFEQTWKGSASKLITNTVKIHDYADAFRHKGIKSVIEF